MAGSTFTHCLTKFKLILAQKEKEDIGGLGLGVLGLRKEKEELMNVDNSVVITVRSGAEGEGGFRGNKR